MNDLPTTIKRELLKVVSPENSSRKAVDIFDSFLTIILSVILRIIVNEGNIFVINAVLWSQLRFI